MTKAGLSSVPFRVEDPQFLRGGGACGALLRQMDWTSHPLGAPDQWPNTLRTIVGIILGSRQAMFVCWGPENYTLYNDSYAQICGQRHPAALGLPMAVIWHDIWDVVEPMFAPIKAGNALQMDNLHIELNRNGYPEEAHFSFSYTPLRDDRNEVAGLFCACAEKTEQVMLQRKLDHEGKRLGQMFEQSPSFIAKVHGPDHVFEMANPAYIQMIGQRDIIGKSVAEALPEVAGQGFIDMLDSVYTTGQAIRLDGVKVALQRSAGTAPEDRFVDFVYQPVRDMAGAVTGIVASGVDVTIQKSAATALESSEQFLRSIISASQDCIKVLDLQGLIGFMSEGGRGIMEVPDEVVIDGWFWPDFWQEPTRAKVMAAIAEAQAGTAARFQGYGNTMAGNRRYWDVRVTPMLDATGQPTRILAVSRDITYLKQIEEEREHLMTEMSHRLKNAFAMVQSVINQTLRKASSVQEGHEVLSGRIRALAAAQDILTRSIASEMRIDQVVEAALLPHRTGDGAFAISGPAVTINGRQSLGLSLALHELATNATKYGALSGVGGCVTIGWDVRADGVFTFQWQETGGPPVGTPLRSGFGSVLIEKIVATYFEGSAQLDFDPAGVAFRLTGVITAHDVADATDPY